MTSLLRTSMLGTGLALGLFGCSGGHGFLGTDFQPKGDITFTNPNNGATIITSLASPFVTSLPGFTIGIQETNYDGPYTVTMTSWNNGFNEPCFGFTTAGPVQTIQTNPSAHINTVTFTAINANAPSAPASQPNPCIANGSDEETAQISDGKGNVKYFYLLIG